MAHEYTIGKVKVEVGFDFQKLGSTAVIYERKPLFKISMQHEFDTRFGDGILKKWADFDALDPYNPFHPFPEPDPETGYVPDDEIERWLVINLQIADSELSGDCKEEPIKCCTYDPDGNWYKCRIMTLQDAATGEPWTAEGAVRRYLVAGGEPIPNATSRDLIENLKARAFVSWTVFGPEHTHEGHGSKSSVSSSAKKQTGKKKTTKKRRVAKKRSTRKKPSKARTRRTSPGGRR